jgi:hypothetical protein
MVVAAMATAVAVVVTLAGADQMDLNASCAGSVGRRGTPLFIATRGLIPRFRVSRSPNLQLMPSPTPTASTIWYVHTNTTDHVTSDLEKLSMRSTLEEIKYTLHLV